MWAGEKEWQGVGQRVRLWRAVGWGVAGAWVVALSVWRFGAVHHPAAPTLSVGAAATQVESQATLVPDTFPAPAAGSVALGGGRAAGVTLEAAPAQGGSSGGEEVVRVGPVAGEITVLAWLPKGTTAAEARALGSSLSGSAIPIARVAVTPDAKVGTALGRGWTVWRSTQTTVPGLTAYGFPEKLVGPPAAYVLTRSGKLAYMAVITARSPAQALQADITALARQAKAARKAPARLGPGSFALAAIEPDGEMGHVAVGTGKGPTLVDFFATWCHACKEDMRILKAYSTSAASQGLPPVVAVDLRLAEPSTAYVKAFAKREALPFPVALDQTGQVTDQYRVSDIPVLALVSANGTVLWRHGGVVSQTALEQSVKAALKG